MRSRRPLVPLALAAALTLAACGSQASSPETATVVPTGEPSVAATASPAMSDGSPSPSRSPTAPSQAPSPSPSAGEAYDACGLLSADRLAAIVGPGAQGNAMAGVDWMAAQCAWNTADSSFLLSVGTPASIAAGGTDSASLLAAYRQAGGNATELTGVGDAAVQSDAGLAFTKGGAYVELVVMGPTIKPATLIRIAKLAAAGL